MRTLSKPVQCDRAVKQRDACRLLLVEDALAAPCRRHQAKEPFVLRGSGLITLASRRRRALAAGRQAHRRTLRSSRTRS